MKYRAPLFWDINKDDIEEVLANSDEWVVIRVFDYGTIEDILEVIRLYGRDKVKHILSGSKLRPMARSMAYIFLDVDSEGRYA